MAYPEFFGQSGTYVEPKKAPPWLAPSGECSKYVPPDTLKIHFLSLSVLEFLCKAFSKSLELTLRKTPFRG